MNKQELKEYEEEVLWLFWMTWGYISVMILTCFMIKEIALGHYF
jgi:hypothetical protein